MKGATKERCVDEESVQQGALPQGSGMVAPRKRHLSGDLKDEQKLTVKMRDKSVLGRRTSMH